MKNMNWNIIIQHTKNSPKEVIALIESKDFEEVIQFVQSAPEELRGLIVPYLSSTLIARMINAGQEHLILEPVKLLPIEKIISIFSLVNKDTQPKFRAIFDGKTKNILNHLTQFGSSFVGSAIEPCSCFVLEDSVVERALDQVKDLKEFDNGIYVLNKEHELIGVINSFKLLKYRNDSKMSVLKIMSEVKYRIAANTPIHSLYQHRAWRDYASLPVVDTKNHLIGIITYNKLKNLIYPKYKTPYKSDVADDYVSLSELIWHSIFDLVDSK